MSHKWLVGIDLNKHLENTIVFKSLCSMYACFVFFGKALMQKVSFDPGIILGVCKKKQVNYKSSLGLRGSSVFALCFDNLSSSILTIPPLPKDMPRQTRGRPY